MIPYNSDEGNLKSNFNIQGANIKKKKENRPLLSSNFYGTIDVPD